MQNSVIDVVVPTTEYVVLRTMDNIERWPEGGIVNGCDLIKAGIKPDTLGHMVSRKAKGGNGVTNLTPDKPPRWSDFDCYEVKQYLLNSKPRGKNAKKLNK